VNARVCCTHVCNICVCCISFTSLRPGKLFYLYARVCVCVRKEREREECVCACVRVRVIFIFVFVACPSRR
jgi:hypothetical protein